MPLEKTKFILKPFFELLEFFFFFEAIPILNLEETNFMLQESFSMAISLILFFLVSDLHTQIIGDPI